MPASYSPGKKKPGYFQTRQCDYLEERKTDLKCSMAPECVSLQLVPSVPVDLSL
jgi:hypothetical protein